MSHIAFIFPGQGSQTIGMGVDLAESSPEIGALYKEAGLVLGWDLLRACREGPEERLKQTDVAQPALYVAGYAAAKALQSSGIVPHAVAGHSIGEYAALAAADVFSFREGLELVRERGRLMQTAAQTRPGGMVAVLGLSRAAVESLCTAVQAGHGVCMPVNFNSPEQIVVAGERQAVEALAAAAAENGAKRVIPLSVSGAFHTPLMKEAAAAMRAVIEKTPIRRARCPVSMNRDGRCRQEPAEIQSALVEQLDHPVEWVQSMEALKRFGCTVFVECGPGRVLSGLLRRIDKQLQTYSTDTAGSFEEVRNALAMARKGSV